ncbi:unnamed protein product [Notodromas monacha]|uniref:Uncharacterized protein n=1 Tax=Notodromas monacha TaxID=399045 RepID=A0A7R9C357_9CRUS|nr:unnamed protein product [Notodromas monacha]CAG0925327.1 unnamed protein product [Notodromas monacha]
MGLLELVASNIVSRIVCLASDFVLLGIFNFIKKKIQQVKNGVPETAGSGVRRSCCCWGQLWSRRRIVPVSGRMRRGGEGRRVTFVGATLFLDCVRQADLKEVKLLSPMVCVGRRADMDRVVTPWRWCKEVVPPKPEISTAAVPPVVDEPRPVAPMANLAVVHVPASKTPFVVRAPPLTQQSVVVAQEAPNIIRAPSSTPEVTVNIKHGVVHVKADVDPWTAMVLVFMGLGGAGATSLAVFLVWLVKFIRNKSSYMRELVRMLTPEDQPDPEAQPVVDLLGLEEADKPIAEEKEEELPNSFSESDQQMDKIPVEESISNLGSHKGFMEMAIVIAIHQEESGMDPTDVRIKKNENIFFSWHQGPFVNG